MRFEYDDRYARLPGPRNFDWYTRQGALLLDANFAPVDGPASGRRVRRCRRASPNRCEADASGVSTFVPITSVSSAAVPTLFPGGIGLDWRLMVGVGGSLHTLVWFDGQGTMEMSVGPPAAAPAAAAAAGGARPSPPLSFRLSRAVLVDTPGSRPQKNFMWLPLPGLDAEPFYVFSFAPLVIIRCPIATGKCSDVVRQSLADSQLPPDARHWRGSSSFVPLPERSRFPASQSSSGAVNQTVEIQFLGLVHVRVFHARYVHRFVLLSVRVPGPQAHGVGARATVTERMAAALTSPDVNASMPLIRVLGASDPFDLMDASAELPASKGGVYQVTFGMSLHLEQRPLHPDCGKLVLAFGRDDRQAWAVVMPLNMAINSLKTFNQSMDN